MLMKLIIPSNSILTSFCVVWSLMVLLFWYAFLALFACILVIAREAKGELCTSPKDETDPSGDSKVSDRIMGQGNALEYWRWGFFFFWLFDKVHEDKNLLVFDLAMIPFSVPTTISDLGPENVKENFYLFLSFHTVAWLEKSLCV